MLFRPFCHSKDMEFRLTIVIPSKKLAFFTAPKVACTSFKTKLFEVENSFDFKPFHANGVLYHIHHAYPAKPFAKYAGTDLSGFLKIAVVRDPVKRFLSAYSNRVGYYNELSQDKLPTEAIDGGLKPTPSLDVFIEDLKKYQNYSFSIRLHTQPLTFFLGHNPLFYDKVFRIEEISEVEAILSQHLSEDIKFPKLQTGGEKIPIDRLGRDQLARVKSFYKSDYDVFGQYFERDALGLPA